jgi:hypothetical protein
LAQSLGSTEEFHQGSVGYPFALFQARKRMVRNLCLIDQFSVTDLILVLNVEYRSGEAARSVSSTP